VGLIYAEAVVALVCWGGILFADPCVVKRTADNTKPLPLAVESWVATRGERPKTLERYLQGPDRTIYCTKCLVWRPSTALNPVSHYHCNVCQRCCSYHDHHCNVLGRCIAGKGFRGNLWCFYGLLSAGAWALFTVCASVLYACSLRYGTKYAVPIGTTVILVLVCCCTSGVPFAIVCKPLVWCLSLIRRLLRRWCW
jgi:hypothetical protein